MNKHISLIALVAALVGGILGYEIRGIVVAHQQRIASQQGAAAIIGGPATISPWGP